VLWEDIGGWELKHKREVKQAQTKRKMKVRYSIAMTSNDIRIQLFGAEQGSTCQEYRGVHGRSTG
jgi:hypothetical protein